MKSKHIKSLELALDIPRALREQPINAGHLRMLAEISGVSNGLNRVELLVCDTHEKPTVDARIMYLESKGLASPKLKSRYHDRAKYCITAVGKKINTALMGRHELCSYKSWLDKWIALPKDSRESPANVGHMKAYAIIKKLEQASTSEILEMWPCNKQTLMTRLKWLERKRIIDKYPKSNLGGNGNPSYFTVTNQELSH